MHKKILICGHRSFVAAGLYEKLDEAGCEVDCFSRGKEERDGNEITGDVFEMSSNKYLDSTYDMVLNFILVKDESIERNLAYIKELVAFCKSRSVNRLIHISSLMVYANDQALVDENTEIKKNSDKEGYAAIKIETDGYLDSLKDITFQIAFLRLGYVIAENRPIPYVLPLAFGFALIKGGKKSKEPVVDRGDVHQGIINLIRQQEATGDSGSSDRSANDFGNTDKRVLLFFSSENKTKYQYASERFDYRYLFIPKWLVLNTAQLLKSAGILSKAFYKRVEGMYVETIYDSTETEEFLNIKF
jgi:nucleoside-diphosphate-sugar epimerase